MTRRLVATLLVFTALVLVATVVPLGISISARDRSDYSSATLSLAQSLATLAEDSFDDPRGPLAPTRLGDAAGPDAVVEVRDLLGQVVVHTGPVPALAHDVFARALAGHPVTTSTADDVIAAVPVVADGTARGVVVVARSDEPVEHRIARLWAVLALVAGIALLLSVALAAAAARWVSLPLRRLQSTAHRWSEGSLHERANPTVGPPEVREVAAALNVMAARLDTLVHGSRAVVADVSHQLRTPLAAMRLRLELIRDELRSGPSAGVEEDLALSLAEVDRLSRMVDGLLAVARAESTDDESTAVDVTAVLRERVQAWQPVAEERGVVLNVDLPDAPVVASATAGHLEQILDNLLDNSLEAMPDGGHVDLSARRDTDDVTIEVRDDGVGMTPDQQLSAFRRFASGRPGSGTGLGLAVVHRLVTADGGDVTLQSEPGAGTRVTIRLPVARRGELTPGERPRR